MKVRRQREDEEHDAARGGNIATICATYLTKLGGRSKIYIDKVFHVPAVGLERGTLDATCRSRSDVNPALYH